MLPRTELSPFEDRVAIDFYWLVLLTLSVPLAFGVIHPGVGAAAMVGLLYKARQYGRHVDVLNAARQAHALAENSAEALPVETKS